MQFNSRATCSPLLTPRRSTADLTAVDGKSNLRARARIFIVIMVSLTRTLSCTHAQAACRYYAATRTR